MEQVILDINGDPIPLDSNGDQIIISTVVKKHRRPKQKITLEFITNILTDKYHNSMTVSEIKSKYGIGHDAYKFINSYSDAFIAEFGKKKKIITTDELQTYWKTLSIE
jgi:predicted transposase YdaD